MCGRYTLTKDTASLMQRFELMQAAGQWEPRYNIAPTQAVAVILEREGVRLLERFHWGLIPFWAKDPKIGQKMINARAETLAEKPSFKVPLVRRRCLIPCTGFYEWKASGKLRQPLFIHLSQEPIFAIAGLWESWRSPEGQVIESCTIITCPANEFMRPIHERMPAILSRSEEWRWLDPGFKQPEELLRLLQPYPSEAMRAYPVSPQMNKPQFEGPACLEPLAEAPAPPTLESLI